MGTEGSRQKHTSIVLWRHSIVSEGTMGKGCLKTTKFERTYFMDGPLDGQSPHPARIMISLVLY